jgi:pimeloyl-ACP methyl ester carboxylesterase
MAAALAQAGVDQNDKQAVIQSRVDFFGVLHGPAHPYDADRMRDLFTREIERDPNFQSTANHQIAIAKTPAWRSNLASLDVPTLVIHGTADPILPYEHGVALAKDIPGAELLPLEGVGHDLPDEEMDTIVPAILRHTA